MAGRPAATTVHSTALPDCRRQAIAVDGKTLRGSGHHGKSQIHLLAPMDHTTRAVLGQTDVDHTTNEVARFQPLLEPTLHHQLATPPWREVPVSDHTRDHGHHRVETRWLQVTTVAGLDFPHATQAIRITRRVRPLTGHKCGP